MDGLYSQEAGLESDEENFVTGFDVFIDPRDLTPDLMDGRQVSIHQFTPVEGRMISVFLCVETNARSCQVCLTCLYLILFSRY